MVDVPQDCIHLLASMEQDGYPDLDEARELLQSLKGGCNAGTRVANIDSHGNVYSCPFARYENFYSEISESFTSAGNGRTTRIQCSNGSWKNRPGSVAGVQVASIGSSSGEDAWSGRMT